MIILLWDIDGTILRQKAQTYAFHRIAIENVLGIKVPSVKISGAGMTDFGVLCEILSTHNLCVNQKDFKIVIEELDKIYLQQGPGTHELLGDFNQLHRDLSMHQVTNALQTGNTPTRAKAKLSTVGVWDLFNQKYSYYGNRVKSRLDLIEGNSLAELRDRFAQIYLIGDTCLDVELGSVMASLQF